MKLNSCSVWEKAYCPLLARGQAVAYIKRDYVHSRHFTVSWQPTLCIVSAGAVHLPELAFSLDEMLLSNPRPDWSSSWNKCCTKRSYVYL
jgi:hypothetical protein